MALNINRIIEIYEIIKKRLPSTYPKPILSFFVDDKQMIEHHKFKMDEGQSLLGAFDGEQTMSLPLSLIEEFESDDGQIVEKPRPLSKMNEDEVIAVILHELFHAYYLKKYGSRSKQYSDEKLIDNQAYRWLHKMKKEKLF